MPEILIIDGAAKTIATEEAAANEPKEETREKSWEIERDARALLEAKAVYDDKKRLERALKLIDKQKELIDSIGDDEYLKTLGVK